MQQDSENWTRILKKLDEGNENVRPGLVIIV